MSTTIQQLEDWHTRGVDDGADYMIIACDTFDHSDYPIYVHGTEEEARQRKDEVRNQSMTRIMEIYDMKKAFINTGIREMAV